MTPDEKKAYHAAKQREYYERNKEAVLARKKEWREQNKDKVSAYNKEYGSTHKEEINAAAARRRAADPEKHRNYYKAWYEQNRNPDSAHRPRTGYVSRKERYANDENYRIRARVHADMWKITRGILKGGKVMQAIGCTLDELSRWIEQQFEPGMDFDNLGEWEVDHVKPLSTFDLSDAAQYAEALHYTNLRPRWKSDNRGSNK